MINGHHLPVAVYYENPEWFRPRFAELDRRSIQYVRIDAGCHGYDPTAADRNYALLVNRMSASAYLRGNAQRDHENRGAKKTDIKSGAK
jgi:hypothetical protein